MPVFALPLCCFLAGTSSSTSTSGSSSGGGSGYWLVTYRDEQHMNNELRVAPVGHWDKQQVGGGAQWASPHVRLCCCLSSTLMLSAAWVPHN